MKMKFLLPGLLMMALIVNQGFAQKVKMKSIFNGKTLKGWTVTPEDNIWWEVKDGNIHTENDPTKTGSTLWTNKEYGDFIVELDFLMGKGTVDSGVFLRTDKDQIQIGISGSLKRDMTGSPYIPGKSYPKEASGVKELLKLNDWNTMKIKVEGQIYTVWLNGQEVVTYQSENMPEKGPIGLQLHPSNEMSIDFKNIKVGKL
ncbi:putative secreted glycosyl hydrolase [Cyclobacterium qasimii M12-11B]|nr:putative secreted glycosyl hydrolase [Cyclobacterium qasimii M12-11B]